MPHLQYSKVHLQDKNPRETYIMYRLTSWSNTSDVNPVEKRQKDDGCLFKQISSKRGVLPQDLLSTLYNKQCSGFP